MGVKNTDLADFVASTLNDLPKDKFEIAWDNQDYEFCRIHQTNRTVIDGGNQIERKVMLDTSGSARYRRLYDTDEPTVGDVLKTIKVGWTQPGSDFSWDKLEILRQKNSVKGFIQLMRVRRVDGYWKLAKLIEERGWKTPTNSTDDLYPFGIPYYINMVDADSTTGGFVGKTIRYQDATTGTICANIDANIESRWRNYAAVYSKIDNALLKTFRLAFLYTNFKPPLIVKDLPASEFGKILSKRIYTDFDNAAALQDLADTRDDNHSGGELLGNIRVNESGVVTINRVPVVAVPQLNSVTDPVTSDATSPIYFVDFAHLIPYIQDGYWLEESEPMWSRGQHTTFTVFIDGSHQILCDNRRQVGFVLHKAITA